MEAIDLLPCLNIEKVMIYKIKLFSNDTIQAKKIATEVEQKLIQNGFKIVDKNPDLAIAIGGDGSFLRMMKKCNFNSDIYYIGINAGTLGFLQEVKKQEVDSFIEAIKNNYFKVDKIGIQETKVITKDSQSIFFSLNEIVIRDQKLNTLKMDIKIEDTILERAIGDGVLISTSIGSTAYNLSYGGAIVYNTLHTLQITPIAPLNNKAYRNLLNSMIVPEDKSVTMIPVEDKNSIIITVDGENKIYKDVYKIETQVKDKRIQCLRLLGYDFTKIVNEKFLQDDKKND